MNWLLRRRPDFLTNVLRMSALFLSVACISMCTSTQESTGILVSNVTELKEALKTIQPGDTVLLASGEWKDALFHRCMFRPDFFCIALFLRL